MSVIIKGMDIPIDCLACRISCDKESYRVIGRPPKCPLTEAKTGDLISRADAIDALEDNKSDWDNDYNRPIEKDIQLIKALPSAEAVQGWIPCSERLPDNKTYVLTTIQVSGRQPHARSGFYHDGFFHNDNGDTWKATDREVKAWMPLPDPYREDGE